MIYSYDYFLCFRNRLGLSMCVDELAEALHESYKHPPIMRSLPSLPAVRIEQRIYIHRSHSCYQNFSIITMDLRAFVRLFGFARHVHRIAGLPEA